MSTAIRHLLTASATITTGMLAGRLLGLLREIMLAVHFGAGTSADIAIALLIIPDFITNALIAGSASAALIPAFAFRTSEHALALFWQALLVSVIIFTLITLIIAPQGNQVAQLVSAKINMTSEVSRAFVIAMIGLPLMAATWVITAWLQFRRRFAAPAFANAVFNSIILLTLWLAPNRIVPLAIGILSATAIRLITHIVAFRRSGGHLPAHSLKPWQMHKALFSNYLAASGNGLLGILPQYIPYIVVTLGIGGIALFNYAFKLVLLPGGLIQTIVQMALLPWLVNLRAGADEKMQKSAYELSLHVGWLVSFSLGLALMLASEPIAALCFGHGRMSESDITTIAHLFKLGIWALPGMVLTVIWQQVLYANDYAKAPLLGSLIQSLFILPLCFLGQHYKEADGIMLAFALIQTLPVCVLAYQGYKRKLTERTIPSLSYLWTTLISLAVFLLFASLYEWLAPSTLFAIALAGIIGFISLAAGLVAQPGIRLWAGEHLKAL